MSIVTCRSHLPSDAPQLSKRQVAGNLFNYIGGTTGTWRMTNVVTHSGQPLKPATHVEIVNGQLDRTPSRTAWILRAVVSTTRYITREEPSAALKLIRKSPARWSLAQNERRELIEARSKQMASRMRYLPTIARRLQLNRNLGESFDFVTWFEYGVQDTCVFDDLVGTVRASEEWQFVEREIDMRLTRNSL